jgi:hypothetical protein
MKLINTSRTKPPVLKETCAEPVSGYLVALPYRIFKRAVTCFQILDCEVLRLSFYVFEAVAANRECPGNPIILQRMCYIEAIHFPASPVQDDDARLNAANFFQGFSHCLQVQLRDLDRQSAAQETVSDHQQP